MNNKSEVEPLEPTKRANNKEKKLGQIDYLTNQKSKEERGETGTN
jgi:hypothetical protein